jgi:hypothetical protein
MLAELAMPRATPAEIAACNATIAAASENELVAAT